MIAQRRSPRRFSEIAAPGRGPHPVRPPQAAVPTGRLVTRSAARRRRHRTRSRRTPCSALGPRTDATAAGAATTPQEPLRLPAARGARAHRAPSCACRSPVCAAWRRSIRSSIAEPPGSYRVLFSDNITDRMRGIDGPAARDVPAAVGRAGQGLGGRPRQSSVARRPSGLCDQGPALLVNGRPVPRRGRRARRAAVRPDPRARAARRVAAGAVRGRGQRAAGRRAARRSAAPGRRDPRGARPRPSAERHRAAGRRSTRSSAARLLGRGGAGFTTGVKWESCSAPAGDAARRGLQRRRGRARHVQGPRAARRATPTWCSRA
ncbi:MAG: hypothetical protein MZV70_33875 [Desulfobacterales bacterium]|nr:hypothetical protein [Desulfobacterales bacterium]